MRKMYQKKTLNIKKCVRRHFGGFTLIELLVVVLIIGILAAVAVPQYYKAKAQADFVQIRLILKEIHRARQLYIMAGGSNNEQDFNKYPDLQLPAGAVLGCRLGTNENGECVNGDASLRVGDLSFGVSTANVFINYSKGPYRVIFKLPVHWAGEQGLERPGQIKCGVTGGEEFREKSASLCKLLSGGKEPTTCQFVDGPCWLID